MDAPLIELAHTGAVLATAFFFLIAAVFAFIFAYHWFTYGTSKTANVTALGVYAGGSVLLLLVLWLSASNF